MKFVIIFCAQNALASRMVKEEEKVVNFRTNEFEDEYPALILDEVIFDKNGSDNLVCWRCHEASYEECEENGTQVLCEDNQESCQLEVRERKGVIIQVRMGCKQKKACENNMSQNFRGWKYGKKNTQCRPEPEYNHSVCRQCCFGDNCVRQPTWWYPISRMEWSYKG